ncbi:MAG: branched-chain amino acid ABC transporter permease [Haloarculaceae archaeon]
MSDETAAAGVTSGGTIQSMLAAIDANRYQTAALVIWILGMLTLPVWGKSVIYVAAFANIWAIFAMGWDIISGHTGYISFGHSFISGTAAYTTAILIYVVDPNMSIYITFPLSVVMAVVAGLVFGVPSLRLRGPYFSVITFVAVLLAVKAVYVFSKYTNGELGISGVSVLSYNNTNLFYLTLFPMLLIAVGLVLVSKSNIGTILLAIRDNEPAVEAAGLDTTKFKIWGFVISSVAMGIGGTMLAHFYGNVQLSSFLVTDRSIEMIAMAVIGGMGTILGPIAGAYLLVLLRDSFFRIFLGPNARWIALWVVVLVIIVSSPEGLFRRFWRFLGYIGEEGIGTYVSELPGRLRGYFSRIGGGRG